MPKKKKIKRQQENQNIYIKHVKNVEVIPKK